MLYRFGNDGCPKTLQAFLDSTGSKLFFRYRWDYIEMKMYECMKCIFGKSNHFTFTLVVASFKFAIAIMEAKHRAWPCIFLPNYHLEHFIAAGDQIFPLKKFLMESRGSFAYRSIIRDTLFTFSQALFSINVAMIKSWLFMLPFPWIWFHLHNRNKYIGK